MKFILRNALPDEYDAIGKLMVHAYSNLKGFLTPEQHPKYYEMLRNVGELTKKPGTQIIVAVSDTNHVAGAVVYFNDMQHYGSGGTATKEKNAAGFRLLAVDDEMRGKGVGKLLTLECIARAKADGLSQVIIHTTLAMQNAWSMYERIGFKRSTDLDFQQGELTVFGFRYFVEPPQ